MPSDARKKIDAIRRVMVKSLQDNFLPFPVDISRCAGWTTDLPRGGETVIYTSFMYQLSGLFRSYEKHLSAFSSLGGSSRLASLGKLFMRPERKDIERSYRILRSISGMLIRAGVEHGYLYEEEPYSGGLLLELGLIDEFKDYGKKVLDLFSRKGVKRVVTVDPHTNNAMLRLVDYYQPDLEVTNYLSLVRPTKGKGEFVLHDPCLYTRYAGLGGRLREVLDGSGVRLKEDLMVTSRQYGSCCGGPLGPVDIDLSDRIAERRAESLKAVSNDVLVACPLCYQNLSPHLDSIKDIAEVIS